MITKTILAFRKPLLMIAWLLVMKGAAYAQNLRETFSSPNGKIEWKAEGEDNKVKAFDVAYRDAGKGNEESLVLHITGYGLNTGDGGGRNLVLKDISKPKYISEHYQMLMGKKSEYPRHSGLNGLYALHFFRFSASAYHYPCS